MKHTKEPWELSHQVGDGFSIAHEIAPKCGRLVPVATAHILPKLWKGHEVDVDKARENAKRIVACVNFCASVPNAELVPGGLLKLKQTQAEILTKDSSSC